MVGIASFCFACAPTQITKSYTVQTNPQGEKTITESMSFTQAVEIPKGKAYREVTEKLN